MGDPAKVESTDWTPLTTSDDQLREAVTNEHLAINLLKNNEQEYDETFVLLCHENERQTSDVQGHATDTRQAQYTHVQPICREHPDQEKHSKNLGTGSVALHVDFEKQELIGEEPALHAQVLHDPGLHGDDHDFDSQEFESFDIKAHHYSTNQHVPENVNEYIIEGLVERVGFEEDQYDSTAHSTLDDLEDQDDSTNVERDGRHMMPEKLDDFEVLDQDDSTTEGRVERDGHHMIPPTLDDFEVVDQDDSTTEGRVERDGHHMIPQTLDDFRVSVQYNHTTKGHVERDGSHMMPRTLDDFRVLVQYNHTTEGRVERDGRHMMPRTLDDFRVSVQYNHTTKGHVERDGRHMILQTLHDFKVLDQDDSTTEGRVERDGRHMMPRTLDDFRVLNQYDHTTEGRVERDGCHMIPQTLDDFEVVDQDDSTTEGHAERDGRHMIPQTLDDFEVEDQDDSTTEGCVERDGRHMILQTLDDFEVEDHYDHTTKGRAERDGCHMIPQTLDDFRVLDQYDHTTKGRVERDGCHMIPQTLDDFEVERASVDPSYTDSEEYLSGLDHGERASRNPTSQTRIPGWPNPVMEHMFRGLQHFEVPAFGSADVVDRNGAEQAPEYFDRETRSTENIFDNRDAFDESHAERQGSEDPDAKIYRICNVNSVQISDPMVRQTFQGIESEEQSSSGPSTDRDIAFCDPSADYEEQGTEPSNEQLEHHDPLSSPSPLLNLYAPDDLPYSVDVHDDLGDDFINLHPHHDDVPY